MCGLVCVGMWILVCVGMWILVCGYMYVCVCGYWYVYIGMCVYVDIGMCVYICVTDQSSFHGTQFVFHSRTKSAIALQELAKAAILLVLDFYA